VFINKLRMPVATQQHAEIIEPGNDALEFHAIHQENGEWNFIFADVIEKGVLKILCAVGCHGRCPVLCAASPAPRYFLGLLKAFLSLCFRSRRTVPNCWPARLLEGAAGSDASPSSRRPLDLSDLRVTVVSAPERNCHRTGLAVTDNPAVDPDNGQYNLAC